jgi:hypothetical protein
MGYMGLVRTLHISHGWYPHLSPVGHLRRVQGASTVAILSMLVVYYVCVVLKWGTSKLVKVPRSKVPNIVWTETRLRTYDVW